MFCPFDSSQSMPLWAPPTPPRSEGEPELYLDSLLATMYNEKPMTEFQLPPVYVDYSPPVISHNNDHLMSTPKQEDIDDKASADGMSGLDDSTVSADDLPNLIIRSVSGTSLKTDPSQMMRSGFSARSLFDQGRSNTTTGVGKRDRRMSNYEVAVGRDQDQDGPEWQVYEELALMETLSKCQNLPTSLQTLNPGHVPNWDFASMQLANVSPFFRGHTQCKQHYENFVAPREDGRMQQNDPVLKRLKMNMALGDASLVNLFKKGKVRTQMLFDHEGRNIICDLLMQRANSLKEAARKMPLYQMGKLNYGQSFGSTSVLPDNHVQSLQSHGVRLDPSYRLRPSQALELREQRTKELEKKREQDKIQQLQVQQQNQQQKNITVSLPTQVSFGGQPVGISFAQQRGAQNVVSFTQVPASAVAAMVRNQQQQAIPINTRNIAAATIQGQSATTGSLSSFYQRNPLTPATGNVPTQVQLVGMPAGANSVGHMSQIINTTTPPQQNARSMSAIGSFTTVSFPATTAGIQADGGNAVYVKQLSQGSGGTQLQLTPHHQQYRVQNLNASPQNIQQGGINVIRAGQNRIQFGQNMGGSHSAGNVSLLGAGSSQSTSGNVGSISYQAMRSVRNSTPQSHSNNSQPQFHISQTLTSAPPRMTPPNSGSQN